MAGVCPECGFPFYGDIEIQKETVISQSANFISRILVVTGLIATLIYFTNYTYTSTEGFTKEVISKLNADELIIPPMKVEGPAGFRYRVQLALTLLAQRAPEFYERISENITSINYVPEERINIEGRRIYLTGVSAYIDPASGATRVRASGAFFSGLNELYDRDIFYLAGVLVHEMRHRELYKSGLNVGGLAEEFEAESTAYDALVRLGAPRSLTYSLWQFLVNPNQPRYKSWERYYRQYERTSAKSHFRLKQAGQGQALYEVLCAKL